MLLHAKLLQSSCVIFFCVVQYLHSIMRAYAILFVCVLNGVCHLHLPIGNIAPIAFESLFLFLSSLLVERDMF